MKPLINSLTFFFGLHLFALSSSAQVHNVIDRHPDEEFQNVHVERLASDSLATTFLIHIREQVPLHRHNYHSEVVYVISGTGIMQMAGEEYEVRSGAVVHITEGTPHSVVVTSDDPLVVISVQSPEFLGKDRELLGN